MYAKGEAVVYPMHGAGIIEGFEAKIIDGVNRNYCILYIPLGNIRIMLCEDSIQNTKLRKIMPQGDIARIMKKVAKLPPCTNQDSWSERYKDNMERIKTGKLIETASVFHGLYQREKKKGLSSAEKKVLSTAKKILLSEIMLSYNVEKTEAEEILEKFFNKVAA